ncbi:MAG: WYL domain-containing protein [Acidimicrobiales bacterium]|nr:WYL domain-containing protein [Actinomycetota bacterium]
MASAPRLDAAGRIQRLLAILQWAAQAGDDGATIDDLCARFGLARDQLVAELEMASMIGADSIHYDEMPFEAYVDGDRVVVRLFSFARPLRLTPAEGLALVAAADALVDDDDPSDPPLRRALAKLAALLGIEPGQTVDVNLDPEGGDVGRLLADAVDRRRRVRFRYWSYGRDVVAERTVDPWGVFESEGAWYLAGRDVDLDDERRFRLDRTEGVEVLDQPATAAPRGLDLSVRVSDDAPIAVLDLPPHARWVAEAHPVIEAEPGEGGRLRVTLAVAGRSWLERLVLRIGPDLRIVSLAPELGDPDVLASAAQRVLQRYRDRPAETPR